MMLKLVNVNDWKNLTIANTLTKSHNDMVSYSLNKHSWLTQKKLVDRLVELWI